MADPTSALLVHGIGGHPPGGPWIKAWSSAAEAGLLRGVTVEAETCLFDDVFEEEVPKVRPHEVALALGNLSASWITTALTPQSTASRGAWLDQEELPRLTAGMVAAWAARPAFRAALRDRLRDRLQEVQPQVVLAHSLGALVAYDLLARRDEGADLRALLEGLTLVTFGAQLGHPALRQFFAGRLVYPKGLYRWLNLYNPRDNLFVYPVELADAPAAYRSVLTPFDSPGPLQGGRPDGWLNHDAPSYLRHPPPAGWSWGPPGAVRARSSAGDAPSRRPARRRALLIGINAYPSPEMRLEGCVNDVFEMSACLQESGFQAEEIRVLLDERATAAAIRERMAWLVEGAGAGDQLVLYYSGHGAQLPSRGPDGLTEGVDEILVPVDFDWTPATAVRDRDLLSWYSQLPYEVLFLALFDCCHAGGLSRGPHRARGVNPPDDIRHRELQWNAEERMWVPRPLPPTERGALGRGSPHSGIGSGGHFRPSRDEFRAERAAFGHEGPFQPVVLHAATDQEQAWEYRHGNIAYGAFTWALTSELRRQRDQGSSPNLGDLTRQVADRLRRLGYAQTPSITGPRVRVTAPLPWVALAPARPAPPLDEWDALDQEVEQQLARLQSGAVARGDGDRRHAEAVLETLEDRYQLAARDVRRPSSLQALLELLDQAPDDGPLRVVGAARSYSQVSSPYGVRAVTLKEIPGMSPDQLPAWPALWDRAEQGPVLQRFHAGCRVSRVLRHLKDQDLHLPNHGAGQFQGLMGAIATGTHGSGLSFPPLAGMVRALLVARPLPDRPARLELLIPEGDKLVWQMDDGETLAHPSGLPVVVCKDNDRFHATLVGLGCLGVVVEVVLAVERGRPRLKETRTLTTWNTWKDQLLDEVKRVRHLEVQLVPQPGQAGTSGLTVGQEDHLAQIVRRVAVDEPARGKTPWVLQFGATPFAPAILGKRVRASLERPDRLGPSTACGLSQAEIRPEDAYVDVIDRVLLLDLQYEATGAEYSVPLEDAVRATELILQVARRNQRKLEGVARRGRPGPLAEAWRSYPAFSAVVTLRFCGADDALISPSQGRDSCLIEVGLFRIPRLERSSSDRDDLYQACREGQEHLLEELYRLLAAEGLAVRPHWGLHQRLTGEQAGRAWPDTWARWVSQARQVDQDGDYFGGPLRRQLGF